MPGQQTPGHLRPHSSQAVDHYILLAFDLVDSGFDFGEGDRHSAFEHPCVGPFGFGPDVDVSSVLDIGQGFEVEGGGFDEIFLQVVHFELVVASDVEESDSEEPVYDVNFLALLGQDDELFLGGDEVGQDVDDWSDVGQPHYPSNNSFIYTNVPFSAMLFRVSNTFTLVLIF